MSSDPLDDFFARKDRAKKDKKSSSDRVKAGKSKKAEKDPTATITIKPLDNDDGEWKEIEEKKDNYEGLKIQSMTIKDKEEEMREKQKEQDAVEQEKRLEEHGGPWKVAETETSDSACEIKDVDPELLTDNDTVTTMVESKANRYVPPSMRNKSASSNASLPPVRAGRRAAPEIENTKEFPKIGEEPQAGNKA